MTVSMSASLSFFKVSTRQPPLIVLVKWRVAGESAALVLYNSISVNPTENTGRIAEETKREAIPDIGRRSRCSRSLMSLPPEHILTEISKHLMFHLEQNSTCRLVSAQLGGAETETRTGPEDAVASQVERRRRSPAPDLCMKLSPFAQVLNRFTLLLSELFLKIQSTLRKTPLSVSSSL
ncbi:unnamed protein product [Pleuronectes platessa]|uniref:Uncharacterized protein n=1 Tax=Pleuronectes platessa TaxID=8262 RepID=A0A9N7V907_PLEPL|nr:unnamed protein product [Pleuronectes platessa]